MAGRTIRILRRTDYSFSNTTGGQNVQVVVARGLDASPWREGIVLARLHACASWPSGSSLKLLLAPDGYTSDDPGQIWNFATTTLITFTQGTDSVPNVKNAEFPTPPSAFGPLAQILLQFSVPIGVSGAWTPTISVDLNLKGR